MNVVLLLNDRLEVSEDNDAHFKGKVTIGQNDKHKDTKMFGKLEVTSNVTLDSNVFVGGGMIMDGQLLVKDSVSFTAENNGSSTFDIDETYTTNIGGDTNIGGNVVITNKSISISDGAETPADTFKVTNTGDITGKSVVVSGDITCGGNVTFGGELELTGMIMGNLLEMLLDNF